MSQPGLVAVPLNKYECRKFSRITCACEGWKKTTVALWYKILSCVVGRVEVGEGHGEGVDIHCSAGRGKNLRFLRSTRPAGLPMYDHADIAVIADPHRKGAIGQKHIA